MLTQLISPWNWVIKSKEWVYIKDCCLLSRMKLEYKLSKHRRVSVSTPTWYISTRHLRCGYSEGRQLSGDVTVDNKLPAVTSAVLSVIVAVCACVWDVHFWYLCGFNNRLVKLMVHAFNLCKVWRLKKRPDAQYFCLGLGLD